jgi:hypothetical protein
LSGLFVDEHFLLARIFLCFAFTAPSIMILYLIYHII